MKTILSVSIPRSGHHLLVQILSSYFKNGQFLYCEHYTDRECCGRIPCDAVMRRAKSAFGTDMHLRLFLQKSHDRNLEVAIKPNTRYIVQLRDPAEALIGWLRWEMTRGWRDNFSLGDVPKNVFEFICYYIRFYHKWCTPGMIPANGALVHPIHYETLAGSRGRSRSALLQLLEWLNLPIDDGRLEHALDQSLRVDSHTGDLRGSEGRNQDIAYYDRLCGGSFRFLLHQVAAFCPGLALPSILPNEDGSRGAYVNEQLRALFFPIDLSVTSDAHLDFTTSERVLGPNSIAVARGSPSICRALGLSYGEKGCGAWTYGDNVILPFIISGSAQTLVGEIAVLDGDSPVDLSQILTLSVVLQGVFAEVQVKFTSSRDCTLLAFRFLAPTVVEPSGRHSALILAIARGTEAVQGASDVIHLCLRSVSLSSVAEQAGALTADDELAIAGTCSRIENYARPQFDSGCS